MKRRGERGFAMLLVFLMAAVIAISLYMEIPRVAFESQRAKEGLLIERGEQYKRAIKVFVAANKRYPASIDELESFNNHRYLRKRFKDPMTGKSEWRLIHIGPGGIFTDSLINKAKNPMGQNGQNGQPGQTGGSNQQQQQSAQTPTDPTMIGGPTGPSAVPKRRDSEIAALCNGAVPGQTLPGQPTGQQPNQPGAVPPVPGAPPTQPVIPGLPGMQQIPGMPNQNPATNPCPAPLPGQPGYTGYTGQMTPGYTGQMTPGMPGYVPGQPPGTPTMPYTPGTPGSTNPYGAPYPTQPGAYTPGGTPFQQPGMTPTAPGMQPNAQQLIQNLLTQPRAGVGGQPMANSFAGNQTIGGGIAGFASTADADGIKIYNEQSNYKKWEFNYDYTKDTGVVGQQGANGQQIGTPIGQNAQQQQQQQQQQQTTPTTPTPMNSFSQPMPGYVPTALPPQPPPPPQQ